MGGDSQNQKRKNKDDLDRPVRSPNLVGSEGSGSRQGGKAQARNKHANDRPDRTPNPSGPAGLGAEHGKKAKPRKPSDKRKQAFRTPSLRGPASRGKEQVQTQSPRGLRTPKGRGN